MDQNIQEQLLQLEQKIDATYQAVEKVRKYMLITAWVTIGVIVLPLVGLLFAIPAFLNSLTLI